MSNSPNTSGKRYQIIRELGQNRAGGRVTYLATDTKMGLSVVIKQFQFAQSDSNWSGLKAYDREIKLLRQLNHHRIPRYLNSFETPKGFCMVQEYKDAQSLAQRRSFTPDEIKQIAISVLEILVYLQEQNPPIMHRDIKPENILVDDQMNVYVVDFGFARSGGGEVGISSVAAGTFGFMAPEQIYNRELSKATDLYGLGATLICLLTGIKSTAIDTLINEDNQLNFKHLVPQLSLTFIDWLQRMVQPHKKNRYPSAATALKALQPIFVNSIPEVNLKLSNLEFKATKLEQKLTQTFSFANNIPKSLKQGIWEVAPHPNDLPHPPDSHDWISFEPAHFTRDQKKYKITVDTSNLMAGKTYQRKIFLHSTTVPETNYSLTLIARTAPLSRENDRQLYGFLPWLFVLCAAGAAIFAVNLDWFRIAAVTIAFVAGLVFGARTGLLGVKLASWFTLPVGAVLAFAVFCLKEVLSLSVLGNVSAVLYVLLGAIVGVFVGDKAWTAFKLKFGKTRIKVLVSSETLWQHLQIEFGTVLAIVMPLLTAALGISLGMGFKLGFLNLFVICAVLVTGLPLAWMIIYLPKERSRIIAKYRQLEPHLIKP